MRTGLSEANQAIYLAHAHFLLIGEHTKTWQKTLIISMLIKILTVNTYLCRSNPSIPYKTKCQIQIRLFTSRKLQLQTSSYPQTHWTEDAMVMSCAAHCRLRWLLLIQPQNTCIFCDTRYNGRYCVSSEDRTRPWRNLDSCSGTQRLLTNSKEWE